ncbi:MAG: winged helix-turn-helix domain-containing protein [Candidatus Eremiobacteraeota bacterium]|nr:winged helix-turn-helix domain-containing protein [Candidatus Eremiobacteraeota bacterium]
MPSVVLTTLGGFALSVRGENRTPPNTRNARALLACLALEHGRVFARDELIERFWPEIDPERGRANLATALWSIRRALEPDADAIVQATRVAVSLAGDVHLDATAFERDVRNDDPHLRAAALRAYRGDFLPEHTDPWSVAQRERLAMAYEAALMAAAREKRDPELAWKTLERDPYAEDAYAILVDHALELGNRNTARSLLARWKAALEEIGAVPDAGFDERARASDAIPQAVDASVLPTTLSSFVGRGADAARTTQALAATRVVTVTGPGGVGKTRLALHVARSHADACRGGLHFVDLAAVAPDRVGDALAAAFGCDPRGGDPVAETARAIALNPAPRLAVIDNCEAVLEEIAIALETLLHGSPHIRFLLTSREPLRVAGESIVPLAPLPPDDAIALFAQRAREAGAIVGDDDETRAALLGICKRLDGIPLALELAAARAAVVPLREYDRWLAERFDVPGGARRGGRPAHRTLRALYDDGFSRLDAEERKVFRRMACIAAPWRGDALAFVGSDGEGGTSAALAALWRLVDKSFVVSESDGDHARYRLLESSRAYGAQRLAESGDVDVALARLLEFYVAAAERVERVYQRDGERVWDVLARALAAERDHVMTALDFALGQPARVNDAIALILAARRVWLRFGSLADAARILRRCLDAVPPEIDALRHGALWAALGDMEATRASYAACVGAADRAIALLRGDPSLMLARSYVQLLNALENLGDPRCNDVRPEAIAAARACADDGCTWYLLCNDALERINHSGETDLAAAEAELAEALAIAERMQRELFTAATRAYLARLDGRRGRFAQGLDATRAVVLSLRSQRAEPYLADALVQLAWFARECRDPHEACAAAAESIEMSSRLEFDSVMLAGIDEFAAALEVLGSRERAALLRGFADRRRSLAPAYLQYQEHSARHAVLRDAACAAHPGAYARGERASVDEIPALLGPEGVERAV